MNKRRTERHTMQFHSQVRDMLWTDTPSLSPSPQVFASEITGPFLTEGQELVRQTQGSRLVLSLQLLSVAVKGNPKGSHSVVFRTFPKLFALIARGSLLFECCQAFEPVLRWDNLRDSTSV